MIYLTIDDGPSPYFRDMLDWLISNNIKASFFCVGHKIKGNEEILHEAIKQGYNVFNHSYSHTDFRNLNYQQAECEILYTQTLIDALYKHVGLGPMKLYQNTGKFSKSVFRFPWGYIGKNHTKILKDNRFYNPWEHITKSIDVKWTLDSEDWKLNSSRNPAKLTRTMESKHDILLGHDHSPQRFEYLKEVILDVIKQN